MMWRVVQTRYEGERYVQCQWEEVQNKKRGYRVTLMCFDSFLQITLVVETLSFKTHVQ